MARASKPRLNRADWIHAALDLLEERGAGGVKIIVLAKRIGMTSGSFYWHFKDLRDLQNALLDYWEAELTDMIIHRARKFTGPPSERIHQLMVGVIEHDAAVHDHAFSIWARYDEQAKAAFTRTIRKRFEFAAWMFEQVGFSKREAKTRGRLMVAYLMGESSSDLKLNPQWRSVIQEEWRLLTERFD